MAPLDIWDTLRAHKAHLAGDEKTIKATIPKDQITPELKSAIDRYRPWLVDALASREGAQRLRWFDRIERSRDHQHADYAAAMSIIRMALERRPLSVADGRLRFDAIGLDTYLAAQCLKHAERIITLLDIAGTYARIERGGAMLFQAEQEMLAGASGPVDVSLLGKYNVRYQDALNRYLDLLAVYEVACSWAEATTAQEVPAA